jgi:hypothetical protein
MGLVFGIVQLANKFGLDAPEHTDYLRMSYGTVQVICLMSIAFIYWQIMSNKDETPFVYKEGKNPFDQTDVETIETTVKEYDLKQLKTMAFQTILGGILYFYS